MKRYFLFLLAANSLSLAALSQNVGIGTNNPQNKLHVAGGLRLDTLVGVLGNGILIHNPSGVVYGLKFTGNMNDVLRGDGSFGAGNSGSGSAAVWLLNGNSGTNPATDFIGTTDAKSLLFRVNNIPAGMIHPGNGNTSFGLNTLASITTGAGNTANGYRALYSNTEGNANTATGSGALYSNTTGIVNTAFGGSALTSNTTGWFNTATGQSALYSNTTGGYNTANGNNALYSNIDGNNNTANGYQALYSNTSGWYNTANGAQSLYANSSGYSNTATGYQSLYNNRASSNTATGYQSLNLNSTGSQNTANGYLSLYSNSSGNYNTVNGANSLYSNSTGSNNTASGYASLYSNTTGNNNTANGYVSLYSNTTGHDNTAEGESALANNSTGNYNTAIGVLAGNNVNLTPSNFTAIGYNAGHVGSNSNTIEIGNTSVTYIGGQVGWSTYSDARIKDNIKENVPGLSFIMRLHPVTYNLNIHHENEIVYKGQGKEKEWPEKYDIEKQTMTGLIAQDVEKAAKDIGYDFHGVQSPKNENDLYSLRYADFVVPLVKAVQEQQDIIEKQQKKIDKLVKELQFIKEKLK